MGASDFIALGLRLPICKPRLMIIGQVCKSWSPNLRTEPYEGQITQHCQGEWKPETDAQIERERREMRQFGRGRCRCSGEREELMGEQREGQTRRSHFENSGGKGMKNIICLGD